MTGSCNCKSLERSFSDGGTSDGGTSFKITTKRFLVACAMAERCGFDMANVGWHVGMGMAAQRDECVSRDPDFSIGLLDVQGGPQKMFQPHRLRMCHPRHPTPGLHPCEIRHARRRWRALHRGGGRHDFRVTPLAQTVLFSLFTGDSYPNTPNPDVLTFSVSYERGRCD